MHPKFVNADRISGEVIGAAIETHRIMGPGLLESIYERCLLRELELRGVSALKQEQVVIDFPRRDRLARRRSSNLARSWPTRGGEDGATRSHHSGGSRALGAQP